MPLIHTAWENDPRLQLFHQLYAMYGPSGPLPRPDEIARLDRIGIHPDCITFTRADGSQFSLTRKNEMAPHSTDAVIIQEGHTLATGEISLKAFGQRMPTKQDFQTIIDCIPGAFDHSQTDNLIALLELPMSGFFTSDKKTSGTNSFGGLWSCSSAGTGMWHLDTHVVWALPTVNWHPKTFGYSVRTLK